MLNDSVPGRRHHREASPHAGTATSVRHRGRPPATLLRPFSRRAGLCGRPSRPPPGRQQSGDQGHIDGHTQLFRQQAVKAGLMANPHIKVHSPSRGMRAARPRMRRAMDRNTPAQYLSFGAVCGGEHLVEKRDRTRQARQQTVCGDKDIQPYHRQRQVKSERG